MNRSEIFIFFSFAVLFFDFQIAKEIFPVSSLSHFCEDITSDEEKWKEFYASANAIDAMMPEPYGNSTNQLIKLIIFKCLRPDALRSAIERFVETFDGAFIDDTCTGININLKSAFVSSTSKTPLIYFSSTGIDATADILNLAYEISSGDK